MMAIGDFLEGGFTGAGGGAAIGSTLGPVGMGAGAAGGFVLGGIANIFAAKRDRPYERQQLRLGAQNIEMGDLQLEQIKAENKRQREAERKRKAMGGNLGKLFSLYTQAKGGK